MAGALSVAGGFLPPPNKNGRLQDVLYCRKTTGSERQMWFSTEIPGFPITMTSALQNKPAAAMQHRDQILVFTSRGELGPAG